MLKHIDYNGRADFFLSDTETKSHRNNVAIEFKINCLNSKLIKHDIDKLQGMKTLNPYLATIFVDFFTRPLNFSELLRVSSSFETASKIYSIVIAPAVENFFYFNDGEVLKYKLIKPTIITTSARLLEQCIIPLNIPTIRIPTTKSMLKFISLCLKPKTTDDFGGNEYIKYFDLNSDPPFVKRNK